MMSEHTPLTLRPLAAADCEGIAEAFARQGWNKPAAQYARYFEEQESGRREVWVAEWAGDFAGYVTVVWESDYAPFRAAAIPEIVDLNVLKRYQQKGIGSALIQRAEKRIGKRSPLAGIGVGLTADYGPAQRLYAHLGYRPDGRGIAQHGAPAAHGATVTVDDDLVLYLTRRIKPKRNRGTAIVETAQGILLASTHDGLFLLPGGGVEPGETHLEATLRELREETGLRAESAFYLFEHETNASLHKVYYVVAPGEPQPTEETPRLAYFRAGVDVNIAHGARAIVRRFVDYRQTQPAFFDGLRAAADRDAGA